MAGAPKGNTNATKEHRLITNALRRAVVQSPDKLKKACEKVLDDAVGGNLTAFNTIADRLDGRPAQSLTLAGDEENPLQAVVRQVVKASNPDS